VTGDDPADHDDHDDPADHDDHDDRGLDLARSVARSLARGAKTPRRRRDGPPAGRRRPEPSRGTGAHPDDRDPQTLDASIDRLVSDQGWSTDVRVHGVFTRWDAMVGREVAQHVLPEAFEQRDGGGRLVVRTDSTAWATQMRLLAPTVLRRLNDELGADTVAVIDVRGPHTPSWKRGRRSVRDGRGPRDTYG
jgi:predicted nucleic acid-binding Zn ribbon protein